MDGTTQVRGNGQDALCPEILPRGSVQVGIQLHDLGYCLLRYMEDVPEMSCRTKVNLSVRYLKEKEEERLKMVTDLLEDTIGIINKPKEVKE